NFGGVISGPVWLPRKFFGPASYDGHNRSFFLFGYEGLRRRESSEVTLTVPTAALRGGDFRGVANLFDPATTRRVGNATVRDPLSCNGVANLICPDRIDAVARAMLDYYPAPNRPGNANNYFRLAPTPTDQDALNVRLDHQLNANQRATFRYGRLRTARVNTVNFPGPAGAGSASASSATNSVRWNFAASHTATLSPTLVNNFSFGYFLTRNQQFVPGQGEGWATRFGFTGVSPDQFPLVTLTGLAGFGGGNQSSVFPARNYDLSDSLTWVRNRHTLKLGGQFRRLRFDDQRGTGVTFGFDSQATFNTQTRQGGNSFASFLLGIPTTTSVNVREPSGFSFRYRYYAGYLQDDFRVGTRLTLNLGLRWETTTPRTEAKDLQTVFNLQTIENVELWQQMPVNAQVGGRIHNPWIWTKFLVTIL
ncbi:MAG: hypothetical protein ACREEM_28015, partial [Blastocatellia bacterium]